MAAISGRSDGRLASYIYASGQGGVIDYRLSAWDAASPEKASEVFERVKNGSYRGREKLARVDHMLDTVVSSSRNNVNFVVDNDISGPEYDWILSSNGNIGTPAKGSLIVNGKVMEIEAVARVAGDLSMWFRCAKPISVQAGDSVKACFGRYSDITVEGEFTQTTHYGDPSILLNAFPDGWLGVWGGLIS